jgi:hypothetical protein
MEFEPIVIFFEESQGWREECVNGGRLLSIKRV